MSMTEAELAEAQRREYGTYVATETIFIGGARAFNAGDAVPVGHVEDGLVPRSSVAKKPAEKKEA